MLSKTFFIRIFSFFLITLAWYFGALIIAIPLTLWHLVQFKAYECIGLGILIDLYFMPITLIPIYTLCFIGIFFIIEIIKPRFKRGPRMI